MTSLSSVIAITAINDAQTEEEKFFLRKLGFYQVRRLWTIGETLESKNSDFN